MRTVVASRQVVLAAAVGAGAMFLFTWPRLSVATQSVAALGGDSLPIRRNEPWKCLCADPLSSWARPDPAAIASSSAPAGILRNRLSAAGALAIAKLSARGMKGADEPTGAVGSRIEPRDSR